MRARGDGCRSERRGAHGGAVDEYGRAGRVAIHGELADRRRRRGGLGRRGCFFRLASRRHRGLDALSEGLDLGLGRHMRVRGELELLGREVRPSQLGQAERQVVVRVVLGDGCAVAR